MPDVTQNSRPLRQKLTSRKFWLTQQTVCLSVLVPLLFKYVGLSETVTLTVLGTVGAVGSLYGVINTVDKKLNGPGGEM